MKKIAPIYLTILSVVCLGWTTIESDSEKVSKLLNEIQANYSSAKHLNINYTIRMYKKGSAEAENFNCKYLQSGSKVFNEQLGTKIYQNVNHRITIDSSSKSIVVSNPEATNFSQEISNFSESLKLCENIGLTQANGQSTITLTFSNKSYPAEKIIITLKDKLMNKVDIYHNKNTAKNDKYETHTTILYNKVILNEDIGNKSFDYKTYVYQKDGKWILQPQYNTYKLYTLK